MSQIVNEISDNISIITDSVSKRITNNLENLSEVLSRNLKTLHVDINNNFSKLSEKSQPKWLQILITISCFIIIVLIFFTQSEVSNIKLKAKDASLILILLALLAYMNGYEKLFLLLLVVFIIIYFTPNGTINRFFSGFSSKKEKKIKQNRRIRRIEEEYTDNSEINDQEINNYDGSSENEITLDTDIEEDEDENVSMVIRKKE